MIATEEYAMLDYNRRECSGANFWVKSGKRSMNDIDR